MPKITPLLDNIASTASGLLRVPSGLFGGFDLNCDGTNTGTLIIRDNNSTGNILYNSRSLSGKVVHAPIQCSGQIYYNIAGLNADVMLFQWWP